MSSAIHPDGFAGDEIRGDEMAHRLGDFVGACPTGRAASRR
jgi:hypothetical protein